MVGVQTLRNGVGSAGSTLSRAEAIIAREIKSRYTGDPLGYAWAYLTPLAWIGVIYLVFHIMGRQSPIDADVGSFILSGIIPYVSFRYTVNAVLRARTSYRHILSLPTVSPPLVYGSVSVLELYNALAIYLVLLAGNFLFFGFFEVADPLTVLFGFTLSCGIGASLGFAIASLARHSEIFIRMTPIVLRPTLYISAVFYTANELPPKMLEWISWNPLLHAVEIMRSGLFRGYDSNIATAWIPIAFIVATLAIGIGAGGTRSGPAGPEERQL